MTVEVGTAWRWRGVRAIVARPPACSRYAVAITIVSRRFGDGAGGPAHVTASHSISGKLPTRNARPVSHAEATDSARARFDIFGVTVTTRGPFGP
jgi:hypothetical protein